MASDYRREFKNKTKDELLKSLKYYNDKLQDDFLGTLQDYYIKRISYIESLLNK